MESTSAVAAPDDLRAVDELARAQQQIVSEFE